MRRPTTLPRVPGDSPVRGVRATKFGGRYAISNWVLDNNAGVPRQVTVIDTQDLGEPTPMNIQIRFANIGTPIGDRAPSPTLPFQYPATSGATFCRVKIRRSNDPSASPTVDVFDVPVGFVLPIDTVTAQKLGVEVEAFGVGAAGSVDDTRCFVEAIATPVTNIGPKNTVYPWSAPENASFIATNAAAVSLLGANSDRQQFTLCNTSTDADLMIQLGLGPSGDLPRWLPTPRGSFVLPRNMFATYESPPGNCCKATIYGIWSNAGNGGVLVHAGRTW